MAAEVDIAVVVADTAAVELAGVQMVAVYPLEILGNYRTGQVYSQVRQRK